MVYGCLLATPDTPGTAKGCCMGKDLNGSFYVILCIYIFKNCGKSTVFNLVCGKLFVFYVQIELVALPQQPKCTYSSHCHTHILQCPAPEPQHFRKGPSPSKDRCCRHGSEDKEFREWFEQFRQLSQPCQWRWR